MRVFLVFLADEFQKFSVGLQSQIDVHLPGFRIRLRIVDRHLQIHVSKVSPVESFDQMKLFGCGVPRLIQPELTVRTGRFHDERVSFPLADGESLPRGPIDDFWKRPAIRKDLAERGSRFIQNHGQTWGLKNLERSNQSGFLGWARRQAARAGVIF